MIDVVTADGRIRQATESRALPGVWWVRECGGGGKLFGRVVRRDGVAYFITCIDEEIKHE